MTKLLRRLTAKKYPDWTDPAARAAFGRLSGLVGIACNLLLFAAKLTVGTLSGSVSITADAVNNLSDASGSVVTLLGFRMAAKPADEEHPYGHARVEYLAGLIVSALILVIGLELAKTSVGKILHPEAVRFSAALAAVLVLSILVKLWMAAFNRSLGKEIGSTTLLAAAADSRNDVIATAAVLLSCVVGALTGAKIDGYMGLLVALFILWSGIGIAKDTLDPLLGAAPDPELAGTIRKDLLAEPLVLGVHDLMIHDYGPGRKFASVHAEIDAREDVLEAHEALDELERACMRDHRVHLTIHYDPVVTDDAVLNRMQRKVRGILAELDPRLTVHDFRMVCGKRHTNLIFDVVVPYDLKPRLEAIRQETARRVQAGEETRYHTIINFDDGAFNQE